MRTFATAARRGAAAVNNPADIEFKWERSEGVYVDMTAHAPTTGQIALFLGAQGKGAGSVRAMFELLSTVLDDGDYDIIEDQLREGLDVAVIIELVQFLTEEWSGRPTQQPSDSSSSQRNTGPSSTVVPLAATSYG